MNFENPTPLIEQEPHFPSLEEIKAKMESLINQEKFEVLRTLEDEKGVYLYEVVTVDESGDASQYTYRRKGNYVETKAAQTCIDMACCIGPLEDKMFISGTTLSNYDESTAKWTDEAFDKIDQAPIAITVVPTESYLDSPVTIIVGAEANALEKEKELRVLYELFTEAEKVFGSTNIEDVMARENSDAILTQSIRKEVRPLLNAITTQLQSLSNIEQGESLRKWDPSGYITEEQFETLRRRRAKLLNAMGAINIDPLTKKAAYRHDIEPLNLIDSDHDKT